MGSSAASRSGAVRYGVGPSGGPRGKRTARKPGERQDSRRRSRCTARRVRVGAASLSYVSQASSRYVRVTAAARVNQSVTIEISAGVYWANSSVSRA